jgi:adenosylhomocysteine nucleosidase
MVRQAFTATVAGGRLRLDVPADLPDGEIELFTLDRPPLQCDRLLFVVTDSERDQLAQAAAERSLGFELREGPLGEYFDLGKVGDSQVFAIQTVEGSTGFKGSAGRATHWKVATGAKGLIGVGMAFGINRELQKAGDVLVSTHLLPYDQRTIKDTDRLPVSQYPKVQALPASRVLLGMLDREIDRVAERPFRIHRGAVLSGGAKIHCGAYRDHLVSALLDRGPATIVGGEMEGVGLMAAAERAAWIVVKGIIDFADKNRDEEFKNDREAACRNAAGLVLDAIRNESPLPEAARNQR